MKLRDDQVNALVELGAGLGLDGLGMAREKLAAVVLEVVLRMLLEGYRRPASWEGETVHRFLEACRWEHDSYD